MTEVVKGESLGRWVLQGGKGQALIKGAARARFFPRLSVPAANISQGSHRRLFWLLRIVFLPFMLLKPCQTITTFITIPAAIAT